MVDLFAFVCGSICLTAISQLSFPFLCLSTLIQIRPRQRQTQPFNHILEWKRFQHIHHTRSPTLLFVRIRRIVTIRLIPSLPRPWLDFNSSSINMFRVARPLLTRQIANQAHTNTNKQVRETQSSDVDAEMKLRGECSFLELGFGG